MATVHKCPWCGFASTEYRERCRECGGAQPPPEGSEGPPPPPPPREIPRGFVRRLMFKTPLGIVGLVLSIDGFVFAVVGAALSAAGIPVGYVFLPAGAVAGFAGFALFRVARAKAKRVLRALVGGTAVRGTIVGVDLVTTVRVNGRHPWEVTYEFEAGGRRFRSTARTWDARYERREAGSPVHVLYVPEDPFCNTPWPPIR